MGNQPWLDRVREQLLRQALPPSYVHRFLEELADHLEDLKRKCNHGAVATRFVVFAISPVFSYTLLFFIVALAISIPGFVAALFGRPDAVASPYVSLLLMYVGPTVVAALLYCKLATRFGSGRKWMFVSCRRFDCRRALAEKFCWRPLAPTYPFTARGRRSGILPLHGRAQRQCGPKQTRQDAASTRAVNAYAPTCDQGRAGSFSPTPPAATKGTSEAAPGPRPRSWEPA